LACTFAPRATIDIVDKRYNLSAGDTGYRAIAPFRQDVALHCPLGLGVSAWCGVLRHVTIEVVIDDSPNRVDIRRYLIAFGALRGSGIRSCARQFERSAGVAARLGRFHRWVSAEGVSAQLSVHTEVH
jgi:hypothetical protein